jgi:hypothetical protein
MPNYVVETYVPSGDATRLSSDVEGIRQATERTAAPEGGRVHHLRSYLVPTDEMGFHIVDAERREDVERLMAEAGIDIERVVESIGIEPRDVT